MNQTSCEATDFSRCVVHQIGDKVYNEVLKKWGCKYYLTLGEPVINTPDKIKKACIKALLLNKTFYTDLQGLPHLRSKIKNKTYAKYQIAYSNEEIIITNSSTHALYIAINAIAKKDDEIILFSPAYPLYKNILQNKNINPIYFFYLENKISIENIEKLITNKTKAIIINSPNNPLGYILNDDDWMVIKTIILKYNIYLIVDACYEEIIFDNQNHFKALNPIKDKLIMCHSFSKTYQMTGWRLGYILASNNLIESLRELQKITIASCNSFVQYGALEAFNSNLSFLKQFDLKRRYTFNRLTKMQLNPIMPQGGFYFFINIKPFNIKSVDFCEQLAQLKKVGLVPGIFFNEDDYVRLTFTVAIDTLIKALDLLESFINEKRGY